MSVRLKIRSMSAVCLTVLCLSSWTSLHAAPASVHAPVRAMFGKTKLIKLNLRNDSSEPLELKVGDNVMKLDAGKLIALSLPVGTRILANTATPLHPVGSVVAEVRSDLDGATLGIK